MNPLEYYRSVTKEIDALKSRVRYLIAGSHWLTDGEWKESVLRAVLRRHMPPTVGIGRGFIVGPAEASAQIDVLLYDTRWPLLHQDGDLVFVTPDAVRGVIEVKATIRRAELLKILEKLGDIAANFQFGPKVFVGLFGYESEPGPDDFEFVLRTLQKASRGNANRVVNHVCAGTSLFVRYWEVNPLTDEAINAWYSYTVSEIAAGYFLANTLEFAIGQPIRDNLWAWFPSSGKEIYKSGERRLTSPDV